MFVYNLFINSFIFVFLLWASYYDLKTYTLPNFYSYVFVLFTFSVIFYTDSIMFIPILIAFIVGFFMAELEIWGGADSVIMILMVALLGYERYILILIFVCAFYMLSMMIYQELYNVKKPIALMPAFFISYVLYIIFF